MGANYGVNYIGPAPMLLQLRDELDEVMPGRFRGTDGFITGYDSQRNPRYGRSGHNPNSYGHVMAFDISTPANGDHITEAEGRSLADYLRTQMNIRFRYLIHDQGPAAPEPMIAGDFSRWAWARYEPFYNGSGGDAHSNHIHLSLTDDYLWGDDCGLSPDVYNVRGTWEIKKWYDAFHGVDTQGSKPPVVIKPVPGPAPSNRKTYPDDRLHWVVESGDTITKIANYYGVPERVGQIIAFNGVDPNRLQIGDKIWIPGLLTWKVEAPDEIRSIAAYYGLDPGYLARLNGLPGPDATIYIGNELIIQKG